MVRVDWYDWCGIDNGYGEKVDDDDDDDDATTVVMGWVCKSKRLVNQARKSSVPACLGLELEWTWTGWGRVYIEKYYCTVLFSW
jgi:hypothetical protein